MKLTKKVLIILSSLLIITGTIIPAQAEEIKPAPVKQ